MHRLALPLFTVLSAWLLLAVVIATPASSNGVPSANATPMASPVASPVVETGCTALGPYFLELADFVRDNEGLRLLRAAGFDALALSDADAELAVTSLDELIAGIRAIAPPHPAATWHSAYVDQIVWYRAMAATRDPLTLQSIINDDRRLFGNLGRGLLEGQSACGYAVWNDAWKAAFGD